MSGATGSGAEHDAARAVAHSILGNIAHNRGDFDRAEAEHTASLRQDLPTARALAERALDLHRRAGNAVDACIAQVNLANLCVCAVQRGALDEAEGWARDSVALKTEVGDRFGLAESLDTLAQALHARGADDEARIRLDEQLDLVSAVGAWRLLPVALLHRAQLDAARTPERAARLLGAALGQQRTLVGGFAPHEQAGADTRAASLSSALGERAFAAARDRGENLSREEAIALALAQS